MATKRTPGQGVHRTAHARKRRTVGGSIVQGLKEAIAWTEGKHAKARVTLVQVPEIDVRRVRLKMRLSQKEFAGKFGFPPATLRNWEQGRSRPDTPTRVLLAVLAKHPEAVEDVLRKAG
jgi:putative transcriptional regulator